MDEKPAVHPLLASRWSPTRFDPVHEVSAAQVEALLEAASWAPSAGNSQPWAFHACRRGTPEHARLLAVLAPSSAVWAPQASLLVVNLCHRRVEGTDWDFSEFAEYDLGQAVAHMTLQGVALGLAARQFRAFDKDALSAALAAPDHWDVMTMTAFGVPVDGRAATASRIRGEPRWSGGSGRGQAWAMSTNRE